MTGDSGAPAGARRRISSGAPWEAPYGYSRAIIVGDRCWVSGTADPSGEHPGDAAGQARAALAIIGRALEAAGFTFVDVVRTRTYIIDQAFGPEVMAVHGEVFGSIRPAATLVVVAALIEPGLLVEFEVDAVRD
ncbi:MAG: Rid family hydrolase [Chloroflexota bacterium]